jgi:16S rRNA (adenine1518-N6/adenine1519-N6)-dimethyltransferase
MDLNSRKNILPILQKYNVFAKKSFGQNFLINEDTLDEIVKTAELSPKDTVIEVGPGLGVLTAELAKIAKKVISLELDRTLLPLLAETLKDFQNIEILNQDALKYSTQESPYKIVANIPYNITSHLINHFLQAENKPTSLTLLVQKEVAQKMFTLEPDMTVLSLQVAIFGKMKLVKIIPAGHFHPAPKVDSAIIHIKLFTKKDPEYIPSETALKILKVAKICFSGRRKKLRNTLPKEFHEKAAQINLDLSLRPERLSTKQWRSLLLD